CFQGDEWHWIPPLRRTQYDACLGHEPHDLLSRARAQELHPRARGPRCRAQLAFQWPAANKSEWKIDWLAIRTVDPCSKERARALFDRQPAHEQRELAGADPRRGVAVDEVRLDVHALARNGASCDQRLLHELTDRDICVDLVPGAHQ